MSLSKQTIIDKIYAMAMSGFGRYEYDGAYNAGLFDLQDWIKEQVETMTIDEIATMVHDNARNKGFHFPESDESFLHRELLNSIGEIAEIQEAYRDGTLNDLCDKKEKMLELGVIPLTCIEEEYVDLLIRTLDQMRRLLPGRSIERLVMSKHAVNLTRPAKHGRVH